MKIFDYDVIVIGSGCAGYNTADSLFENGVKKIAIVTEGRMMGTSRNTGSDKQTYYKLSLSGDSGDSIKNMAETLFAGGAMDGDIALCEASNSVTSFIKLCKLGVDFPTNDFGEYVGYKTDHDPYMRATSIGPYTSKKMTEVLEREVMSKKIMIFDNSQVIKILTDNDKVTGLLCLDVLSGEYFSIKCPYVVLATGGPAGIYFNSVYPESQTGSSALALDAKAKFVNLSEWQYGLASIDFRWNVSGTYMQVLPRYISIDENGVEREFLLDYMDKEEMLKNIFLKGYEWPFDVRKIKGSSYIDLLVYNESVIKGRKVYLDFTREPSGLNFDTLDKTAYEYLKNSEALIPLPIARLKKMNRGAISLYKEHGIDIEKEPLRIAVCAQHNNGGVEIDSNWQTNIKGLYVVGEAAGTFGIFRPGGTALNSTQVGGIRSARHIAYYNDNAVSEKFDIVLKNAVAEFDNLFNQTKSNVSNLIEEREKYQKNMSKSFAFLRNKDEMKSAIKEIDDKINNFAKNNKYKNDGEKYFLVKNLELLKMQKIIAEVMFESAKRYGSRGSAFVLENSNFLDRTPVSENENGRKVVLEAFKEKDCIEFNERPVKPIPDRDLWFEKVWNKFRDDRGIK